MWTHARGVIAGMGASDRTEEPRGSAVMREHGAVVARVCMALLGDAAAAELALERVAREAGVAKFEDGKDARAVLMGIARGACANQLSKMPSRLPIRTAGWGKAGQARRRRRAGPRARCARQVEADRTRGRRAPPRGRPRCGAGRGGLRDGSRDGARQDRAGCRTAGSGGETTMSDTTCLRFQEDIVGLLEGTASDSLKEHVATCDFCRDARHDLESVARLVGRAGDDFEYTPALAERLAAAVVEAAASRISETRIRESNEAAARAAAAAPSASASASASAAGPPLAAVPVADSVVVSPAASRSSSSASPSPSASASASNEAPEQESPLAAARRLRERGHQHGRGLQARRPPALTRARSDARMARQGREGRAQRRRQDRRPLRHDAVGQGGPR